MLSSNILPMSELYSESSIRLTHYLIILHLLQYRVLTGNIPGGIALENSADQPFVLLMKIII